LAVRRLLVGWVRGSSEPNCNSYELVDRTADIVVRLLHRSIELRYAVFVEGTA